MIMRSWHAARLRKPARRPAAARWDIVPTILARSISGLQSVDILPRTHGDTRRDRHPPVHTGQMTTPFDYDRNPERFRLATRVTRQHLTATHSLYDHLAELLVDVRARRVLDIGCGEGALRAALPAQLQPRLVGLDASATMLRTHPPPVVLADAAVLPFPAGVFDAAVAISVLDHLPKPTVAIAEAHRVLAPGGSSSPQPPAATTRRSWPTSGGPRPPASTPRTHPDWWRRSSGRCRSSAGMRRWSGCPTATRSATT
jgi:SAM-dependent methyltransferase